MDQALDALLELDERAVVDDVGDLAGDLLADRVARLDVRPGVLEALAVAEGDALLVLVDAQHHDLDLVADLEVLARVAHAAPRDVGHVQQPVDAAEVDEHAVVGDVLDRAGDDHPLLEAGQRLVLLVEICASSIDLARQHDVGAPAVEVDDAGLDLLADVVLEAPGRPQVDERAGQERPHADVHRQAALDALEHLAANGVPSRYAVSKHFPDAHLGRALARQADLAESSRRNAQPARPPRRRA